MSSDPNTRIPTFQDLGNPGFSGPRPGNPQPHMSGHVPPPVPFHTAAVQRHMASRSAGQTSGSDGDAACA